MKLKEKIKAIKLREQGCSYSEILKKIKVSKSTISLWLRDIELSPEQRKKLLKGRELSRYMGARAKYKKRLERTKEIIIKAKQEVKYNFKNSLFLAGLMLYWAEGSDDVRERVKFSNSDPAMIRFMMNWFRKYCNVPEEKFRISLHIHALHCRKDIEKYWSRLTGVSLSQFHKIIIKPTTLKYKRNPLYNGTCNIVVSNKDLFRKIKGWKDGFIEKLQLIKGIDNLPP